VLLPSKWQTTEKYFISTTYNLFNLFKCGFRKELATPRTSEAKDCSQNANLHRPLTDMGMLEKS
jgi:hypothetical protein